MLRLVTSYVTVLWWVAACTVTPLTPTPSPEAVVVAQARQPTRTPTITPTVTATRTATLSPSATATLPPAVTPAPRAAAVTEPLLGVQAAAPSAAALPSAAPISAEPAQRMIDLINSDRAAAGLSGLLRDEGLMGIAQARAEDMVARGYLGHDDPATGAPLARGMMRAAGYASPFLGENWYASGKPLPEAVDHAMGWLMSDAVHRANLLSPNFAYVGVGIAFNGELWVMVQNFTGQ